MVPRFEAAKASRLLGHVVSERVVAVDPRKVAAVAEWATPTSCPDVRRWPYKLLLQVCLALIRHCSPAHGPLQPGPASELRLRGGRPSSKA